MTLQEYGKTLGRVADIDQPWMLDGRMTEALYLMKARARAAMETKKIED